MSTRSTATRILKSLAIAYGATCVLGGIYLAEVSVRLAKAPLGDTAPQRRRFRRRYKASLEDVTLTAADGAALHAWFIQPRRPNGKSVLILHGIESNRLGSAEYADIFLRHGYSVLIPDSRDHGESGGEIATYGILERHDVHLWVAWLRHRVPGCTFLLGESMGAAIGLQATAITPDICAAVVEAPYADFRQISYERLGRRTGTGQLFWQTLGRPILELAFAYARIRYGVYLPDADPKAALEHNSTPTLLIAGINDQDIPKHHAEDLQKACHGQCTLWIVPGGEHADAATFAKEEFEHRVIDFFNAHTSHPATPTNLSS